MTRHTFGSIDDDFAEYAVQMITSTGDIYRNFISPLNRSYAKKIMNGTYIPERAIDGYISILNVILPRVKKAYNEYYEYNKVDKISMTTKIIIAKELQFEYEELLHDYVEELRGNNLHSRKTSRRTTKKKRKVKR